MSDKNFARLIGLRRFLLVIGFVLVLIGCTHSSLRVRQTPVSLNPTRGRMQQAPLIKATSSITPATATPTLIRLPEAGGPHLKAKRGASPTPPPPTVVPPTPTATPTQVPTNNPPTAVPHFAPARILIPAINLDASIVAVGWTVTTQNGQPVSEWDVPGDRTVGWLNTTALVGMPGNTVLVGHQNVDGRVFENLEYLQPGDEIQVLAGNELHKYTVAMRTIVLEKDQPIEVRLENARWIGRSNDERLTLITCWPRNDNTHRLILVALPTS